MARSRRARTPSPAQSRAGVEESLTGLKRCTSTAATPASRRRTRSRSATSVLERDRIFINVGGRASVPAMPGLADSPYLTNSSMLDVDFLPEHLIVVGGSYIGLEFGQMFRRFGSEVTIVEMGAAR